MDSDSFQNPETLLVRLNVATVRPKAHSRDGDQRRGGSTIDPSLELKRLGEYDAAVTPANTKISVTLVW